MYVRCFLSTEIRRYGCKIDHHLKIEQCMKKQQFFQVKVQVFSLNCTWVKYKSLKIILKYSDQVKLLKYFAPLKETIWILHTRTYVIIFMHFSVWIRGLWYTRGPELMFNVESSCSWSRIREASVYSSRRRILS